jgi:hypothetical protein
MILLTDLRLLGWAMRTRPVSDVVDQLRIPKRVGFLFMATFGIMLLGCKAEEYYYNPFFRIKVTLLALVAVHALVFRRSVYQRACTFDNTGVIPRPAKLAAGLSMLLWAAVACMGRGIGYLDPPFGLHANSGGREYGAVTCYTDCLQRRGSVTNTLVTQRDFTSEPA